MKWLFTADWQCQVKNLNECERVAARLETLLKEGDYDGFVHLGDVKEDFNPIDQRVANFLSSAFRRFVSLVPTYVVAGNHDRTSLSDSSPSCLPMLQAAGAHVFDTAGALISTVGSYSYNFEVTPYYRSQERWLQEMQGLWKRRAAKSSKAEAPIANFLLFHGEFLGSTLNARKQSTEGLDPKSLEGYSYAIGGHLHRPHRVGASDIWYVGSPFAQDWGEANQQKSFLSLQGLTKFQLETIPTGMPVWYAPDLPDYKPPKRWNGQKVRVRLHGSESEIADQRERAEKEYAGAEIVFTTERAERKILNVLSRTSDSRVLVKKYVSMNPPPSGIKPKQAIAFLNYKLGELVTQVPELEIEEAEATNALSFNKRTTLPFREGVTLITGENRMWMQKRSNGAGKTNLLSFPMLALYGCTAKGQTHDRWVGRLRGTGRVALRLRANGQPVTVERTRRPATLSVTIAGKPVLGDANDVQRALNQIIKLTNSAFSNSLYIGQKEVATILTGTDKERKELLSRFLNLDSYLKTGEKIRAQLSVARASFSELTQCVHIAETRYLDLKDQLDIVVDTGARTTHEKDINVIREKIAETKRSVEKLNLLIEGASNDYDKSLAARTAIVREAGALEEALRNARRLYAAAEKRICGVCGQKLPATRLAEARKSVGAAEERVRKLSEKQAEVDSLTAIKRSIWKKLVEERDEKRSILTRLTADLSEKTVALEKSISRENLVQKAASAKKVLDMHLAAQSVGVQLLDFYKYCESVLARDGIPLMLCREACERLNVAAEHYASLFGDSAIGVRFEVGEDGDLDVKIDNPHGGLTIDDQSEGERRTAALITTCALRTLFKSNVMILDEPGEGLDSVGAYQLGRAINALRQDNEVRCIFVVTHNPHIVAGLEPDHALCVIKDETGSYLVEGVADAETEYGT